MPSVSHEITDLVKITYMCEQFHCLPQEGGLFAQDPYLVLGMALVNEARAEKAKKDVAEAKSKQKK